MNEGRSLAFYALTAFFALFVLFLYGPTIVIFILSFQGPTGGLTFPLSGVSVHWFEKLWAGGGLVDIGAAFRRSPGLRPPIAHLRRAPSLLAAAPAPPA